MKSVCDCILNNIANKKFLSRGERRIWSESIEIFRAYDLRGLAEEDLSPEVVFLFGRAAGRYFLDHNERQVLVGRDNRLSSKRIRDQLVSGLTAAGCRVVDLGEVISPILYYARECLKINPAIMITASHNPPEFNGFKVAFGSATIYGEEIQRLYRLMEELKGEVPAEIPPPRAGQVEERELGAVYLQMLTEKIQLGPRKLKVVVDCGNGTASLFAEEYFTRLGCEVIPLFCTSDGRFPHHQPDPVQAANLAALRETVLREGADLGIGFDGDGDRLGVVDDQGAIIWGDRLMILYWREILPKYPGTTCIVEVKCSLALVEEIERLGGKPIFYKTGHSLIKAKMREVDAVFTRNPGTCSLPMSTTALMTPFMPPGGCCASSPMGTKPSTNCWLMFPSITPPLKPAWGVPTRQIYGGRADPAVLPQKPRSHRY